MPAPRTAAALLLLAAGCAHAPPPEFSQRIRQGRCEDAASFLRANPRGPPGRSRVRQAVTLPLSWILTGVGYTAEATVVVGGGIVLSGVLCTPILALEAAVQGDGDATAECVVMALGAIFDDAELPGVGRGIRKATHKWRCADLSPVSEDLRAIAECYAWRGGDGDLERARAQLEVLRSSKDLLRCVSEAERAAVDRTERWIGERLAAPAADTTTTIR
jgi:hypothetical protein